MRYNWPVRILVWTMGFLLLGCGSLIKVENGSEAPAADLPVEVEGNSEVAMGRVRAAIAAGDMSSEDQINKSVITLYYELGFIEVKSKTTKEAERFLVVVEEGETFSYGTLKVDGPDKSSLPQPDFKTGDTFSRSKTNSYVEKIKQYYLAKDQNATVNPVIDVKSDKRVADVTIEIRIAKTAVAKAPPAKTPPVKTPPVKTPPAPAPAPAAAETCIPTPGIGKGEALVLRGNDTVNLGPGPYRFSRICVKGQAKIQVCSKTKISFTSPRPSVIAGKGMSGFLHKPATVEFSSMSMSSLHVFFDNQRSRIRVKLRTPRLKLFSYALTSHAKLQLDKGRLKTAPVNEGWRATRKFPFCH